MESDDVPTLKVLMIGPSGAGKSALLIRYCDDQFDDESSTATIGVDFKLKRLSVHGKVYRLNVLDTAGQERFRTLSNSYYRGAHGVILVYDISNRESFRGMEKWFEEAEKNAIPGAVLYLVGSKLDKTTTSRAVSKAEGEALAAAHGCSFCEVSSKTRENVRKPFVDTVEEIVGCSELLEKTTMTTGARRAGGVTLWGGSPGRPGGGSPGKEPGKPGGGKDKDKKKPTCC